jgi:SAM-dependent methyltransferase
MEKPNEQYRKIRREVFSDSFNLDLELIDIVKEFSSHSFLRNPASQNSYLYLTNYVRILSEIHFDRPISDLKILDWGTGKGHVTYLLKKLGANPTSCDIETDSDDSSFGQETPILNRYNIDVKPLSHSFILPFDDNSIDIILSFGVLEHVENDFESLKQINRILRPNGLFFCFFLPYTFSWTQRLAHLRGNYYHDRLYSRASVANLLNNSSFSIDDVWHRQLMPKNGINYPNYKLFEQTDQFLVENTFLKHFATNIEFVAHKK